MVSKLEIYNNALGHLGPVRLANLTENRSDRRELDAVWDASIDYMLQQGWWDFAKRTAVLVADDSLTPQVGTTRQYGFAIPDDMVKDRIYNLAPDENFNSDLFDYEREGSVIYSSLDTIYIQYISRDPAFGFDVTLYPPMFVEALGAWLAFKSAVPITKDRQTKAEIYNYHQRFLSKAREQEALAEPVRGKPSGNWASARGRRNGRVYFAAGKIGWRG